MSASTSAPTSPAVQVITRKEYEESYANKQGTLMFPGELWDCLSYCDEKAIKKAFNIGRKTIKAILIMTQGHPEFSWELNRQIPYAMDVFCDGRVPDSVPYFTKDPASQYKFKDYHTTRFPTGKAYIVV